MSATKLTVNQRAALEFVVGTTTAGTRGIRVGRKPLLTGTAEALAKRGLLALETKNVQTLAKYTPRGFELRWEDRTYARITDAGRAALAQDGA